MSVRQTEPIETAMSLDMAAARRTLTSVHTSQAKALRSRAVTATQLSSLHSHKHHFQTRFATPALQRRCPKQIATLSFQRVSDTKFQYSAQAFAHAVEQRIVAIHSSCHSYSCKSHEWQRCSSSLEAESQDSRGIAILLLPSVNRIPHDFKCLFIVWKCKCFVPKSALLSCPPTRIYNHSVGVAIFPTCHQDESMRA